MRIYTILHQQIHSAIVTTLSTQTLRNRLHSVGLYDHRPMEYATLTVRHSKARRDSATEHVNSMRNEWRNILFSDESHFSVYAANRRIFIWMERGTRSNPAFVQENVKFGGGLEVFYFLPPLMGAPIST